MAAVLKLRHSTEEMPPDVRVVGKAPDGSAVNIPVEVVTTVSNAIGEAQARALKVVDLFDSEGFAESVWIELLIKNADVPNLTLVDLPGLLAAKADSDEPAMVERIVRKYAEQEGTLLLSVVPVKQDVDTVLGFDITKPKVSKTIFVLTWMDSLVKDETSANVVRRVKK